MVVLYWQLTVVMPRAGGDYVFISRTLSGPVGFVASFLFFIGLLVSAGSGSYWAFAEAGTQLSFAGQVLNDTGLTSLGNLITPWTTNSPWLLFGLGIGILAIGTIAIMTSHRAFRFVVYSFFVYGLIAMILVVGVFLIHSPSDFATAYGKFFQGGVAKVLADATAKGYSPGTTLLNLWPVVPLLFVSIGPYPVMQLVGGEIKTPKRSLLYGLVLAEVVSILVWLGLTYVLDRLVGISFIEAWTLTVGGGYSTVPTVFVTVLETSRWLLWLIVIGLFIGNIGWSWLSIVFISRLVLAWSFDRVLPTTLAYVNERFHTPVTAIFLGSALAIIPMYLEYFTSFITAQVNAIFFYAVVWFFAAISAVLLPYRRASIFETSPSKARVVGVPAISLLGVVAALLFAYLGYSSITNSSIGSFALGAQIFTLAIVLFSIAVYVGSYYYNKARGINLRLLYAQIPPD